MQSIRDSNDYLQKKGSSHPISKKLKKRHGCATTPWLITLSQLKNMHTRPLTNNPQTVLPEPLARTPGQGKNPPDDSTKIARGLGSSCRVHKPGVPHGSASQQRLGPAGNIANNAQLTGRPNYLNDRPEGRSNHRPKGLAKEERRPLPTPARLSNRSARFGLQPVSGRPLRPEGLAKHRFRPEICQTPAYSSSSTGAIRAD